MAPAAHDELRDVAKESAPPTSLSLDLQNARAANGRIRFLRLPIELVEEIFLLTVLEYIREDNEYGLPVALILASVCHHWRAISLAQPKLWAQIPLNYTLHRTKLFLKRSRSALLVLHMFSRTEHGRSCVKEWYQGLATLLREPPVSTRIQKLVFRNQRCSLTHDRRYRLSHDDCGMISRHLLPLLGDLDLPSLRYAMLLEEPEPSSGEPSSGTDIDPKLFLHCPNLRTLTMLCCRLRIPQAYAPLSSLRRLEITGREPSLHYEDILATLKMIPQLCALKIACDMKCDDDYAFDWMPDPDRTHFLPSGEIVCLSNLRELRINSSANAALSLLSRLIYSHETRINLEVHRGVDDEDEEWTCYKAVLRFLIPPTFVEQNKSLSNFALALGGETVSITSLFEEHYDIATPEPHDSNEFDTRRIAIMDTLRQGSLWENETGLGTSIPSEPASPSTLLEHRQHYPPRHFTLTMFVEWENEPFVEDILAPELPEMSDFKLVVQTEHGEDDASSSDDSDDWDIESIIRRKEKAKTRVHKWGAINDTLLPQSWGSVECLQIETYAIPGFAKALMAVPDDPARVLPIIRDLRALDIRGMRHIRHGPLNTRIMEGLQRRTKVLGPLDHLCVEDEDVWYEVHDDGCLPIDTLQTCVVPGGLRIRTLRDALQEQELDWDASAGYPKPPYVGAKW